MMTTRTTILMTRTSKLRRSTIIITSSIIPFSRTIISLSSSPTLRIGAEVEVIIEVEVEARVDDMPPPIKEEEAEGMTDGIMRGESMTSKTITSCRDSNFKKILMIPKEEHSLDCRHFKQPSVERRAGYDYAAIVALNPLSYNTIIIMQIFFNFFH